VAVNSSTVLSLIAALPSSTITEYIEYMYGSTVRSDGPAFLDAFGRAVLTGKKLGLANQSGFICTDLRSTLSAAEQVFCYGLKEAEKTCELLR